MRFYLSSYRLGNATENLKALLPMENKRIAYISNALDWSSDHERRSRGEQRDIEQLQDLGVGLDIEKLDLREYFGKQSELKLKILQFGAIWVCGGNAFVLRQAMKLSGLDNILRELCSAGADMLYGGYSAGISVLGPTLKGIDIIDPPNERPYGNLEIVWDGVGIVDYVIVPHYRSDHPDSEAADKTAAYLAAHEIPFRTLRDGEAIIIENGLTIAGSA